MAETRELNTLRERRNHLENKCPAKEEQTLTKWTLREKTSESREKGGVEARMRKRCLQKSVY